MEFLAGSLLQLIVETSTNLPPDVRAAMSLTAAAETPGTQSAQALDIILTNIDMARVRTGPSARIRACRRSWCTRQWA